MTAPDTASTIDPRGQSQPAPTKGAPPAGAPGVILTPEARARRIDELVEFYYHLSREDRHSPEGRAILDEFRALDAEAE